MYDEWLAHVPELKFLAVALTTVVVLALIAPGITFLISKIANPFTFAHELLLRIRSPLHTLIPLIGLQIVWRSAPPDLSFRGTISHLVTIAIIAAVVWLGLRIVDAGRQVIFKRHPIDISDNRTARRIHTQTQVLVHTLSFFIILFGIAAMLMTFPGAKQIGASLLASAGLAGLAVGFAAKPVLGNLIAGLQIALTQPISLDDVVIVEGEWGRVEEITSTYIVIKIWDERRLIVPLQYFIENPFQNWTRESTQILGTLTIWVDYAMPLEPLRKELEKLCKQVPQWWDGRVCNLQVTDTSDKAIQLRALVSSSNASQSWDLRVFLREKLVQFITANHPQYLPQLRTNFYEDQLVSLKNSQTSEHIEPLTKLQRPYDKAIDEKTGSENQGENKLDENTLNEERTSDQKSGNKKSDEYKPA